MLLHQLKFTLLGNVSSAGEVLQRLATGSLLLAANNLATLVHHQIGLGKTAGSVHCRTVIDLCLAANRDGFVGKSLARGGTRRALGAPGCTGARSKMTGFIVKMSRLVGARRCHVFYLWLRFYSSFRRRSNAERSIASSFCNQEATAIIMA